MIYCGLGLRFFSARTPTSLVTVLTNHIDDTPNTKLPIKDWKQLYLQTERPDNPIW